MVTAANDPEPRLAASLILIDHSFKAEPKLLLGRRHANHVFLPGKFVFPGGRSEPEDAKMTALGTLAPQAARRLSQPATGNAIAAPEALALTAIRELFEETGMLLGDRSELAVSAPPDTTWAQFAAAQVIPDLNKLHYVARALTPPGYPRRFDTHFFAADAKDISATKEDAVNDGSELVELRWVTVAELARLDILPVTYFIALELAHRLAAGLGHDLPVPYFYAQDDRWIRAEV
ncbi:NUDIX hydrolase [Methyloferula stellata]|uniref:NUDIX hydrolase n=1 Tax=Methyloferula stellata TaxID=876270 RepID=UPI00035D86BF|nr:NUDIX hydrolase [Methyloferula stellata]